jgi:hypothetical protein
LVGIRTQGSTTRLWNNESAYENGREKTSLNIQWMLCNLIMHHAKHSSPTRQTVLVQRILNLKPRNPHEQARLSIHENQRPEAGAGNMPRMAQGRAQSPQWQAERGRRA